MEAFMGIWVSSTAPKYCWKIHLSFLSDFCILVVDSACAFSLLSNISLLTSPSHKLWKFQCQTYLQFHDSQVLTPAFSIPLLQQCLLQWLFTFSWYCSQGNASSQRIAKKCTWVSNSFQAIFSENTCV